MTRHVLLACCLITTAPRLAAVRLEALALSSVEALATVTIETTKDEHG